ncbi:uncharacterized protein LOC130982311 [Arachis stenosperma]|uniref:uncharacterized protein LOC130982311 n=1 Tax=Arachis stenosperma TaxID=217475 RepID=UPI0025AC6A9A|nr:uncharacterized protein LOC130982311 [Arachis stenosperma]
MEKNKYQILGSASGQQPPTNEPQGNKQKGQANVTVLPNSKQQQQLSIAPKPYTPQSATEQFLAMTMPTNQWQQAQMFAQLTTPPPPTYWQPQWPSGVAPFMGSNFPPIYQPFPPNGTTDPSCQGVGTSSTTRPLVPDMHYPIPYPYPGFPGPCDPSSWLSQMQQLQHLYAYNFPGAHGYSSAAPTAPGFSASGEQSSHKGIIRPPANLSQKHQQLWEAQSAENVQLWSIIDKLQAEVSDYKVRLTRLEEEVSSLKQKAAVPPHNEVKGNIPKAAVPPRNEVKGNIPLGEVNGNIPFGTGQPRKRGRPRKRPLDILYPYPIHQESQPQTQCRKPAPPIKPHFEIKPSLFEKVILKPHDQGVPNHSTMAKQQTNEKILDAVTPEVSGNIQNNQGKSLLPTHGSEVYQEYQGPQSYASGSAYASGAWVSFKNLDMVTAYCVLPNPKEVRWSNGIVSARYRGDTDKGSHGGTHCIPIQNSAKELLNAASKGHFHNGIVIKQEQEEGAKVSSPGQSSANETEEVEDTNSGSAEDENEDEMEDDTGSSAEETDVPKDEGECTMNNS